MLVLEASSSGIDERFDGLENTDPVKWMYEVYKLFKEEWSRSGEAEKVANVLQEKIMSRGDIEVTEAMCVGILPMHDRDRVCQGTDVMEVIREESLGQLAIFSCWLETLRKSKVQTSCQFYTWPTGRYALCRAPLPLTNNFFRITIQHLQGIRAGLSTHYPRIQGG